MSTGEETAGQLAGAFPHISRPAVSRHLKVLRQSGLVVTRRAGREWRYDLNGRQLAAVYLGWFAQFAPTWEEALRNLKNRAESGPDGSERR